MRVWAAAAVVLAAWVAQAEAVPSGEWKMLYQNDFKHGTYIINQSGKYRLAENINFQPEGSISKDAPEMYLFPNRNLPQYAVPPYRLGFFAALVIAADDVWLDLNGYTIEQSKAHSMMQRFFSVIELSTSPFPPNAGPAAFGGPEHVKTANRVMIMNGRIGRSAHHGIHGNNNFNVRLHNLVVEDFEVSGIHLNAAKKVYMRNVLVNGTRTDVPADGRLSQAILLLQAVSHRLWPLSSEMKETEAVLKSMTKLREAVYDFLVHGKDHDGLFSSLTGGKPDASMVAGVLLHAKMGVGAIQPKPDEAVSTSYIRMSNVAVRNLAVSPKEMGALVARPLIHAAAGFDKKGHVTDIVAGVFDIDYVTQLAHGTEVDTSKHAHSEIVYKPNPFADLQLAVAKYSTACMAQKEKCLAGKSQARKNSELELMGRNQIDRHVWDWADGKQPFSQVLHWYRVEGSHDLMFHVIKGAFGIKIDGGLHVDASNVVVSNVTNYANATRRSALASSTNTYYQYDGEQARGICLAATVDVDLHRVKVAHVSSFGGHAQDVAFMNGYRDVNVHHASQKFVSANPVHTSTTMSSGGPSFDAAAK